MISGAVVNAQLAAAVGGDPSQQPDTSPQALSSLGLNQLGLVETDAIKNANTLKQAFGSGVSTLITLFNASADDMNIIFSADQHGHIGSEAYDSLIRNGQASAVLHVKTSGAATGSTGMVAYNIGNTGNVILLSWSNPFNHAASDVKAKVYVQTPGQFTGDSDFYFRDTDERGSSAGEYTDQPTPYRAQWSIGNETSPHLRVIVSLR